MFKTRLLSGILLVVIALITVITGGNVLFATLFLISMIGVYELYRVFEIENKAVGICGFLFVSRILWSVVCQTAASRYNGLVHAVIYGICDLSDGSVGIFLSKISDRADVGSVFRSILCGSDVVLYLSDKNSAGRCLSGMAGIYLCLGM